MAKLQIFSPNGVRYRDEPDPTEEELAAEEAKRIASYSLQQKEKRFNLLLETDWTQSPDSPLSDEDKALWAAYRTQLRDITNHEDWPDLELDQWPTKPS